MATLYVVGTPIGNLSDISERAKATLACVHTVLCEDTRVTGKMLSSYKISVPMLSYHQHSGQLKTVKIIELLEAGYDLALVTDAGTPTISDPGGHLVQELLTHFGETLSIIPIPGACAAIAALSIAGVSADEFVFLGFPPHKKGRQSFFDRMAGIYSTVIFYESTHRIFKTLDEIEKRMPTRHLVVCRELTKMYETTYRGTATEIIQKLQSSSFKGEFALVLSPV